MATGGKRNEYLYEMGGFAGAHQLIAKRGERHGESQNRSSSGKLGAATAPFVITSQRVACKVRPVMTRMDSAKTCGSCATVRHCSIARKARRMTRKVVWLK